MATASIALRSSVSAASGVPQVQPSCEVCSTASAPACDPGLGEQLADEYAGPPGVADQVAADLVRHAAQGDPGLGELAVDQVLVAEGQLLVDHPVDAQLQSGGEIDGRGQRGVDDVEVVVRRAPRAEAGHARGRHRRAPHRGGPAAGAAVGPARRGDGRCRPAGRRTVSTTTPPTTQAERIRKSRRCGRSASSRRHLAEQRRGEQAEGDDPGDEADHQRPATTPMPGLGWLEHGHEPDGGESEEDEVGQRAGSGASRRRRRHRCPGRPRRCRPAATACPPSRRGGSGRGPRAPA